LCLLEIGSLLLFLTDQQLLLQLTMSKRLLHGSHEVAFEEEEEVEERLELQELLLGPLRALPSVL
jgi:hypothetical protein